MPSAAGHDVRVSYLWEDGTFAGSTDDSDHKPFGSDATLSTLEGSNNAVRVFNPNSREAREIIEQNFQGSWSVEFTLTNPWWIRGVIESDVSTSGSSAPYTHSFDGDIPYSMRILAGNEKTGNERILKGCVATSCSISASVGGMVSVSLEGAYADEEETTPGTGSLVSQPTINERPMTFAQATVSRAGSTLSLVQEASLTIENNTDLIGELGVRTPVDYSPKIRTADISYGDIVEDDSELQRMYGSSSATSPQSKVDNTAKIEFVFDNGESGSSKNLIKFTLTGSIPASYDRTGSGDPEADLEGTLNEMAATVAATAENSSSTAR